MTDATTPSVQTQATAAAAVAAVAPIDETGLTVSAKADLNAIEGKLSVFLHEIETRYEADLAKVKSTFSAVKANIGKLIASHLVAGAAGAAGSTTITALIKHFL